MFDFLQYDVKQPAAELLRDIIDRQIPVKYMSVGLFENKNEEIVEIWWVNFKYSTIFNNLFKAFYSISSANQKISIYNSFN